MEYLTPKKPDEAVAYLIDWSRQLGADTIDTFALTVSSGTVVVSSDPAPENFRVFLRAVISGGADGETAILNNQIVTVGGQTLERDLSLLVADDVTAVTPITTTKRTIVNLAFEEIGLADYEFNVTPEEYRSALTRLDVLMAEWRGQGYHLNYNFPPAIGTSDLEDPAGIPDSIVNCAALYLALRIAPPIGKTMSVESRQAMANGMNAMRAQFTIIPERVLQPGTPRGAGQKPWGVWQPFGYYGNGQ